MIKPAVGRVVWYHPSDYDLGHTRALPPGETCAAIVTYVHGDRMVNLVVFDVNGGSHPRTSVQLVQDDVQSPAAGHSWCEWMPYQKGQAAKHDALAAAVPHADPAA